MDKNLSNSANLSRNCVRERLCSALQVGLELLYALQHAASVGRFDSYRDDLQAAGLGDGDKGGRAGPVGFARANRGQALPDLANSRPVYAWLRVQWYYLSA